MSRYGIISDMHGNLHALQAVLIRLGEMDVDELICLGDIVGYGPFPGNCLDLVYKHCAFIVEGNHDQAILDPDCALTFNGPAREAIHWTRDQLGPLHLDALYRLRARVEVERRILCVHASPVPGPNDYLHDQTAAAVAFGGMQRPVCLVGHTHVPMVFEAPIGDNGSPLVPAQVVAYLPHDGAEHVLRPDRRYICNPGSVGQPRDCDPRASFATLDTGSGGNDGEGWTFTVHRQQYDVCAAQEATRRAGLPTVLADRLAVGA